MEVGYDLSIDRHAILTSVILNWNFDSQKILNHSKCQTMEVEYNLSTDQRTFLHVRHV